MSTRKQIIFPKYQKVLEQLGENIRLARKRRSLTTIQVAERAGIDRTTLYHIEKGNGSVSMSAYFNTLRVLGLQNDFLKLAADDEYGRKLQDLSLKEWLHLNLLAYCQLNRRKVKRLLVLSMTLTG
ncbi:MAG: helix-turn-helix transcriptional regulator [Bacteroidetes bacterium]|nr:helix-turn-helix transcriptional regulator [Bacteroidota bacterium]